MIWDEWIRLSISTGPAALDLFLSLTHFPQYIKIRNGCQEKNILAEDYCTLDKESNLWPPICKPRGRA